MKGNRSSTFVVDPTSSVTVDTETSSPFGLVSPVIMSDVMDAQEDTVDDNNNNKAMEGANSRKRRSQTVDLPSATISPSEKFVANCHCVRMSKALVSEFPVDIYVSCAYIQCT